MQTISYSEHNSITNDLRKQIKRISTIEERCVVDVLLSELFPATMFWDTKNKKLVISVNSDALNNAKRFLNRPTEVYRVH